VLDVLLFPCLLVLWLAECYWSVICVFCYYYYYLKPGGPFKKFPRFKSYSSYKESNEFSLSVPAAAGAFGLLVLWLC